MKLIFIMKKGLKRILSLFNINLSYIKNKKRYEQLTYQVLASKTVGKTLVVIPSETLQAYIDKGLDWLERYYNPGKYFDQVYLLSPYESGFSEQFGMTVIQVNAEEYKYVLKLIKPDVIRSYGGYWATTFAVKNKVAGIPVIASVHDTNPDLLYNEIVAVDCAICMSNAVASLVESRGLSRSKIRIMPNRIDRSVFEPKENLKGLQELYPNNYKYILSIGRLVPQKNIDNILKSLKLLPENYRCIFVGKSESNEYKELASNLGISHKCIWIESIKNSELAVYYSFVDVMCTPSRWEGFGIAFIEAAACEAAIITSNIAPMNEHFIHNESAHLISDYENPTEIAKAIEYVCNNKDYAKQMGKNARIMSEKFGQNKIDEEEVNIYKDFIQK